MSADLGDKLDIKALPILTEQRVNVFVATPDSEMETAWSRYGGDSVFHYKVDFSPDHLSQTCGIAIFRVASSHTVPAEIWRLLQPFFTRAGAEANVFEYCPVRRMFTRRDAEWFQGRVV